MYVLKRRVIQNWLGRVVVGINEGRHELDAAASLSDCDCRTVAARLVKWPETWRRRKRRQSQKIRRSVQKQRRSTVWDNQRKTFGVVISPARLTAWIAASALILLTGTELFGTALSWVKLSPIWHVFSFAVDTRPIATLLDYASHPIDPRSYSSVAVTAVGAEATLLAFFFATVGVVASTALNTLRSSPPLLLSSPRLTTGCDR